MERKEMVGNVARNVWAAVMGKIVVGEEKRFSFSAQEKMMIKKLPSCKAALEQLADYGEKVEPSALAMATQTERVGELERGPGMWFGENQEMDMVKQNREEVV